MNPETTSREFFEGLYARSGDPWAFAASAYERERYGSILHALEHRRYGRAFEPGCSVGVLTEELAPRCASLQAIDISPTAARRAKERCEGLPNVSVCCGALPEDIPQGSFDLIVFSEIGYYLSEETLRSTAAELVSRLRPAGVLLASHWLGFSRDHVLSGDRVHAILGELDGLKHEHAERRQGHPEHSEGFRLDRWVRA